MAALTLQQLETVYGVKLSDKTQLQAYLDTAEAACLKRGDLENGEVEEYTNGGSRTIYLTHGPIATIERVEVAGTPVAYRYDRRASKVVLFHEPPEGPDVIHVAYTVGWEDGQAPAAIKTAIALTVKHLIKLSNDGLIGVMSRTIAEGGTEQIEQNIIPLAAKGLLDSMRRGVL